MEEFLVVAFVMIVGMGVYWTMVLFPRQRDFQKRQSMARSLAEGDEIITGGGLVGRVKKIDSDKGVAYVEIADGVIVRLLVAAMLERYDPEEIAKNAQMGRQTSEVSE